LIILALLPFRSGGHKVRQNRSEGATMYTDDLVFEIRVNRSDKGRAEVLLVGPDAHGQQAILATMEQGPFDTILELLHSCAKVMTRHLLTP
jgi:hypothetical protein